VKKQLVHMSANAGEWCWRHTPWLWVLVWARRFRRSCRKGRYTIHRTVTESTVSDGRQSHGQTNRHRRW